MEENGKLSTTPFDKSILERLEITEGLLMFCVSVESTETPSRKSPGKVRKGANAGVILPYVHEPLDHTH